MGQDGLPLSSTALGSMLSPAPSPSPQLFSAPVVEWPRANNVLCAEPRVVSPQHRLALSASVEHLSVA